MTVAGEIRVRPITTDMHFPLTTYEKNIKNKKLSLHHPLQRRAGQWKPLKQGNFIRRVLQGGSFLPLQICTQYDNQGCEIEFLIDGKQRLTTLISFKQGGFSISKGIIDYIVVYDGILYETKDNKSGKFALKRDRNKNLIPILDEDGNIQRQRQTIDIRGLWYKDLPPELQERIAEYQIPVQVKHNCTDEDIQLEIIDYNSGEAMNQEQKGNARLGVKLASRISELVLHPVVKDKSGFTATHETKSVKERCLNEALLLTTYGIDVWNKSYESMCDYLANNLCDADVDRFESLLDKFNDVAEDTKELKQHLKLSDFCITLANFDYFLEKGYKLSCYKDFLNYFVTDKKFEKCIMDCDNDGEEIYKSYDNSWKQGTKSKSSIEERIEYINEWLDKYLESNCADMFEESEDDEETDNTSVDNYVSEFISTNISNNTEETALKALMQFASNYPVRDFTESGVNEFKLWLKDDEIDEDCIDDCLMATVILRDYLNNAGAADKFSSNDIAILIYHVFLYGDELDGDIFEAWLEDYNNTNNCELSGSSSSILEKDSFLKESYSNFINYINN